MSQYIKTGIKIYKIKSMETPIKLHGFKNLRCRPLPTCYQQCVLKPVCNFDTRSSIKTSAVQSSLIIERALLTSVRISAYKILLLKTCFVSAGLLLFLHNVWLLQWADGIRTIGPTHVAWSLQYYGSPFQSGIMGCS